MHLNDLEGSWTVWMMMEATQWQHLPYPGGLLDQPEWLMQDLIVIAATGKRVKDNLPDG